MTNEAKFKEVFGFYADIANCVAPVKICRLQERDCNKCPFNGWWSKEYKPCFQMSKDFDKE